MHALAIALVTLVTSLSAHGETLLAQDAQAPRLYGSRSQPRSREELLQAIADVRAALRVGGDFREAESVLDALRLEACSFQLHYDPREVLVQLALARSELYESLGDAEKALAVLQEFYYLEGDQRIEEFGLLPLQSDDILKGIEADPRLVQRRKTIENRSTASGNSQDSLEGIVGKAFETGEYSTILEIGAPAMSYFAKLIQEHSAGFPPQKNQDPLEFLIAIDQRRAAKTLLENLNAGGYLWKRRIVRAMRNVLIDDGTWSTSTPFVCLEPEWLDLLEALLLESKDVALQSLHLVEEPFLRDFLTPELQHALVFGLDRHGIEFANALMQVLDKGGVVASEEPVLAAAMRVPDQNVRRLSAQLLAKYESSAALKALASDPDPQIRRAVAQSLGPHTGRFLHRYRPPGAGWTLNTTSTDWQPKLEASDVELVRRLIEDSEADVRRTAAYALWSLARPLEEEVYFQLASDPDPSVRSVVASMQGVGDHLYGRLLAQLAEDSSSVVLATVDDVLEQAPLGSNPIPYLMALEKRRHALDPGPMVNKLDESPAGLGLLVRWALQAPDGQTFASLLHPLVNQPSRTEELDDATLALLYVRLSESSRSAWFKAIFQSPQSTPRASAMRLVFQDSSVPITTRLAAAVLAAPEGGARFREAILQLLKKEQWKESPAIADGDAVETAIDKLPATERNMLVLEILEDRAIVDELARRAAAGYEPVESRGREITLAILARWFPGDGSRSEAVHKALQHLGSLPQDADPELLIAAARHPIYAESAVASMIALRDPKFLETLGACLEANWVSRERRAGARSTAAAGLVYFGEAAAPYLLQGLTSDSEYVRELCAQGIQQLEAQATAAHKLSELSKTLPTKESALVDLARMLEDEKQLVRIEAIQGIASFGAYEFLPQMIRLLDDPNKDVKDAARAAIDKLRAAATNASKP